MKGQENNPLTPHFGNAMLSAYFKSKREQLRFSKFISTLFLYSNDFPDWDYGVKIDIKENCLNQMDKLQIPNGWQSLYGYEEAKEWFLENCR